MTPDLKQEQSADAEVLAKLGYKQELKRTFSALEVFGVAFSIIGILPSIASVLGLVIPNGGPAAMVWGWLAGSFFILCIGLAMGELASSAPTSGGLYYWTYSLSPPKWRKLLSWMVGYANTISTISAVASVDWGCAVQIAAAACIATNGRDIMTPARLYGIYAAVVMSHALLCSLATRTLARLQNVYVVLNVLLCLAVIIALPIATPRERMNNASFALGDVTNLSGWPTGFAFILSMQAVHWTIGAFDCAVHISEEATNAAVAVPYAIAGAIFIAGVLGTAVNLTLAFCMGADLEGIVNAPLGQPMAQIFYNSFGKGPTLGLWVVVVIIQYTMGSSALVSSSRQVFAFSRDGALPLSNILYQVNPYAHTPANAVLFCAAMSLLLGLLVFAGPLAINAVFALAVVAGYSAYIPPIALRLFRSHAFTPGPFALGKAGKGIAAVAVTWMSLISVVFLFPAEPNPGVNGMNYTVVVWGGVLVLALAWFYCPRVGGVHWFRGLVANAIDYSSGKDELREDAQSEKGTLKGIYKVDEKDVRVNVGEGSITP